MPCSLVLPVLVESDPAITRKRKKKKKKRPCAPLGSLRTFKKDLKEEILTAVRGG